MTIKITIVESVGLSTTAAKSFSSETEALAHVVARIRASLPVDQRPRFENSVRDRVVSEDGVYAVSEIVAGTIPFAKALAKAFAPQISIITGSYGKDEDEDA